MGYWNDPPVYQQVKMIMAANPKLTRREAIGLCARKGVERSTNPARTRCSGTNEIARRKQQIATGFIRATA